LEEIFQRKGQDICFLGKVMKFGMKNWGKVAVKQLLSGGGEGCCLKKFFSGKIFEIRAPKKNFAPGPRQALGGPANHPE
jgi:hypothetical protein